MAQCEHETVKINPTHEQDGKGKWRCEACGESFVPGESLVTILKVINESYNDGYYGEFEDD